MEDKDLMLMGVKRAERTMKAGFGGPFGAVVVKDGEVIAIASNSVLKDNDPTAHAEMNAIREACRVLGTYDLTGCELYATGYPCPMCLGAIIWANIKKVYVCGLPEDAEKIGFRDDFIYDFIRGNCKDASVLDLEEMDRKPAIELYTKYAENNSVIY